MIAEQVLPIAVGPRTVLYCTYSTVCKALCCLFLHDLKVERVYLDWGIRGRGLFLGGREEERRTRDAASKCATDKRYNFAQTLTRLIYFYFNSPTFRIQWVYFYYDTEFLKYWWMLHYCSWLDNLGFGDADSNSHHDDDCHNMWEVVAVASIVLVDLACLGLR